jgi:hypothetical protein
MNIDLKNILSDNKELKELLENDPSIKELKTELSNTIFKNKEVLKKEEETNSELKNIFTINIVNFENNKSYRKFEELSKNEHFIKELIKSYSELYSIEDSIKIFNPDNRGVSVIEKLDTILEEIEMKDELTEYIVEIELLREELSKRNEFNIKLFPIINKIMHYCVAFFLEILSYGNINSFYEYYQLSKEKNEDGNPPMIIRLLNKIIQTLILIGINCYSGAMFSDNIAELKWDEYFNSIIDDKEGKHFFSEQVYIEFNEYLLERNFFEDNKKIKQECIIS